MDWRVIAAETSKLSIHYEKQGCLFASKLFTEIVNDLERISKEKIISIGVGTEFNWDKI
jgi:hypothetical protein